MFLALKIYQIKLSLPGFTLLELKQTKSIAYFKQNILKRNILSNEIINKLIEKNWIYNNYESN